PTLCALRGNGFFDALRRGSKTTQSIEEGIPTQSVGTRDMSEPRSQSEIRKTLHEGGVYLTHSGDYDFPYKFAKIIELSTKEMWVKLYHKDSAQLPVYPPAGDSTITLIPVSVFLAW